MVCMASYSFVMNQNMTHPNILSLTPVIIYAHTCTRIYTWICTHTTQLTHTHTMHAYPHTPTHTHTHQYTHTHTHTHTLTHTHTPASLVARRYVQSCAESLSE